MVSQQPHSTQRFHCGLSFCPQGGALDFTTHHKKKANEYNKHYICFACGTHELIIYDKTYQIAQGGIQTAYEKLLEGVLRFEVHCNRDYIRTIEKKQTSELDTRRYYLF